MRGKKEGEERGSHQATENFVVVFLWAARFRLLFMLSALFPGAYARLPVFDRFAVSLRPSVCGIKIYKHRWVDVISSLVAVCSDLFKGRANKFLFAG